MIATYKIANRFLWWYAYLTHCLPWKSVSVNRSEARNGFGGEIWCNVAIESTWPNEFVRNVVQCSLLSIASVSSNRARRHLSLYIYIAMCRVWYIDVVTKIYLARLRIHASLDHVIHIQLNIWGKSGYAPQILTVAVTELKSTIGRWLKSFLRTLYQWMKRNGLNMWRQEAHQIVRNMNTRKMC